MTFKAWLFEKDSRTAARRILLSTAGALSIASFVIYYTDVGLTYYFNPTRTNEADHVVILTTSWCPYCRQLKRALQESLFPYAEIDVEKDWTGGYVFSATMRHGVPVTIVGKSIIGGDLDRQMLAISAACVRRNRSGKYRCQQLTSHASQPAP